MNRIQTIRSFALLLLTCAVSPASAATINLVFDGTTTMDQTGGVWTVDVGVAAAVPDTTDPPGRNGISYTDTTGEDGFSSYVAPDELLDMDFTGMQLVFGFYLPSKGMLEPLDFLDQIVIEDATNFVELELIDETILDQIQEITIDFTDPVFSVLDLANLTLILIEADYYEGAQGIESYLVSVPEPVSQGLLGVGLLGLAVWRRRRR